MAVEQGISPTLTEANAKAYPPEAADLDSEVVIERFNPRDEAAFQAAVKAQPFVGLPSRTELTEVEELPILPEDFQYEVHELSPGPDPPAEERVLYPYPVETDIPEGLYPPQSKRWTAQQTRNYLRGWVMTAPWSPDELPEERRHLENLLTPTGIAPSINEDSGQIITRGIAGMAQLIAGITFAYIIRGFLKTIAAYHTLDSIKRFYPELYPRVLRLAIALATLTWGNKEKDIPAVYDLPGTKRNDRSSVPDDPNSPDGSTSWAGTVMKGFGQGVYVPVVQADTKEAKEHFGKILEILGELFDVMLKITLSKAEYELIRYAANINNVHSFGGLKGIACTSVQLNISSLKKPLKQVLGFQGFFHTDDGDSKTAFTVFNLMLRIPPSADSGAFMFPRAGIYLREIGVWIFWVIFNGRDIHGGFEPTQSQEERWRWIDEVLQPLWDLVGEAERAGYVSYMGQVPAGRTSGQSMTKPLKFANVDGSKHLEGYANWADGGHTVYGGDKPYATRHAREATLHLLEYLRHCNMELTLPLDDLLGAIKYQNPTTGESVTPEPFPVDPRVPKTSKMLRYWKFYQNICELYHIPIQRVRVKAKQKENAVHFRPVDEQHTEDLRRRLMQGARIDMGLKERQVGPLQDSMEAHATEEYADLLDKEVEKVVDFMGKDGKLYYEVVFQGLDKRVIVEAERLQGNASGLKQLKGLLPPELRRLLPLVGSSVPLSPSSASTPQENESQTTATLHRVEVPVRNDSSIGISEGQPKLTGRSGEHASQGTAGQKEDKLTRRTGGSQKRRIDDLEDGADNGEEYPAVSSVAGSNKEPKSTSPVATQPAPLKRARSINTMPVIGGGVDVNVAMREEELDQDMDVDRSSNNDSMEDAQSEDGNEDEDEPGTGEELSVDKKIHEDEYQVEGVEGHRTRMVQTPGGTKDRVLEFNVKFKDYEVPEWISSLSMYKGCEKKIDRYYSRLEGCKLRKVHPRKALEAWSSSLAQTNAARVQQLLNEDLIAQELQSVQSVMDVVAQTNKASKRSATLNTLADSWLEHSSTLAVLDGFMSIIPCNDPLSLETTRLFQASYAANSLPTLAQDAALATMVDYITRWRTGQALIVVFKWFMQEHLGQGIGDAAARILTSQGFAEFKSCSPSLAQLTGHIMHYLARVEFEHAHQQHREEGAGPVLLVSQSMAHIWGPMPKPEDWDSLPADLYGLKPVPKGRSANRIPLDNPWFVGEVKRKAWKATERLGKAVSCVLANEVLGPTLVKYDVLYLKMGSAGAKASKVAPKKEDAICRCITRGAVLSFLVEAVKSDAILASSRLISMLMQPNWIADKKSRGDRVSARKVLNQIESLREGVVSALLAMVSEESMAKIEQMGGLIHKAVIDYTSPKELRRGAKYQQKGRSLSDGPFSLEATMPGGARTAMVILNLLVRESVLERRGKDPADEILGRVLRGKHATRPTSGRGHNPDHTNPARHYNRQAQLLERHLGDSKLTGPAGLSNLCVFFGTGQGWKTESFLTYLEECGTGFWSESSDNVVSKFNNAMLRNLNQVLADMLEYENANQWGTANNHLLVQPTVPGQNGRKLTLDEKFEPYFDAKVVKAWTEFLDDMAGEDHRTWGGVKRSWREALDMVEKLQIAGIAGLTALQLVNSLALLGIVKMPDAEMLADWIWQRPGLGAFRGNMSEEDKKAVGFSALFVEHLLCKVVRWDRRLKDDGANFTLGSRAQEILEDVQKGIEPAISFPCPMTIADSLVAELLARHTPIVDTPVAADT
ncbi:hypothetical protein NMY22_g8884 [Coprinellus aureogranulatus]|nr:hypothetical protein NMY22_g8884 [Coprinellus aureogranulatus]